MGVSGAHPLHLVRHARPLVPPGICYGRTDVPADPTATAQAASRLAATLPNGAWVFSSTLCRATALADQLHRARPDLQRGGADLRLNEMDFGSWEMQAWDAIGADALATWTAAFATHRCGGGESTQAVLDRVGSALQDLRAPSAPTVWITHGGVISAVRCLQSPATGPLQADRWPPAAVAWGASWVLAG